ncbi:hypothetical protein KR074_008451 [Drosophila pseudoananassae]|nr:hypothetical protein KR074_008451 [Drosophila pseudoananassae]
MEKFVVLGVVTLIFLTIAIAGSLLARLWQESSVIRCCIILTCVCCYMAWLVTFLMQLNPLIGPRGERRTLFGIMAYWPNSGFHDHLDS